MASRPVVIWCLVSRKAARMNRFPCCIHSSPGLAGAPRLSRRSKLQSIADPIRHSFPWAVPLALGLAGCERQSSVERDVAVSGAGPDVSVAGGQTPSVSTHALRVHVLVPAHAAVGTKIPIELVVSNAGSTKTLVSQISPPPVYDVAIARVDGRIVWRRLPPDYVLLLAADQYTLAPGESRHLETISWDQVDLHGHQVEPGRYTVQGVFYGGIAGSGDSEIKTPAVPLVIGP
jgi:hypothetical protein